MTEHKQNLSEQDHDDMDTFLEKVLDAYKNGAITREAAVGELAQVMAALDRGNTEEARAWFKQG